MKQELFIPLWNGINIANIAIWLDIYLDYLLPERGGLNNDRFLFGAKGDYSFLKKGELTETARSVGCSLKSRDTVSNITDDIVDKPKITSYQLAMLHKS